jgi:hypothetical protein
MLEDQMTSEQTAFDRYVAQQRLFIQAEGLRLNEERLQLMARLQEARAGVGRRSKLQWAAHIFGVALVKAFQGVQYVVRRALP